MSFLPDELRDHSEAEQIFRLDVPHRLLGERFFDRDVGAIETHRAFPDALLHDLVQADEGTAADEQNFLGVNLNVFLMRVLPSALRWNIARAAFQDFQQRLLHAFAGNVARDANVVGLASDLVDLIDVDDANLSSLHVVVRILQQTQDDVLHIFAHITGFGEGGRVRDAKRNVEDLRECLREQCLA
jgi:hypothetical protein